MKKLRTFWELEKSNKVANYYPTTSAQQTKQKKYKQKPNQRNKQTKLSTNLNRFK